MKKLALSLAVLFAVGMVSCGGNKDKENCADSATETVGMEVVDIVPGDSANGDTTQVAGAAVTETTPAPDAKADAKADNKEEAKDAKADAAAPAADAAAPADGAAAPAETPAK